MPRTISSNRRRAERFSNRPSSGHYGGSRPEIDCLRSARGVTRPFRISREELSAPGSIKSISVPSTHDSAFAPRKYRLPSGRKRTQTIAAKIKACMASSWNARKALRITWNAIHASASQRAQFWPRSMNAPQRIASNSVSSIQTPSGCRNSLQSRCRLPPDTRKRGSILKQGGYSNSWQHLQYGTTRLQHQSHCLGVVILCGVGQFLLLRLGVCDLFFDHWQHVGW